MAQIKPLMVCNSMVFGLASVQGSQNDSLQALGHNSKAVHRAYAKYAEVTIPSLADWEKDWQKKAQHRVHPKLLLVDFQTISLLRNQINHTGIGKSYN